MPVLGLHVRMAARDPDEGHRASTPLELFFDLTFVVAIAQAANSLHHGLASGHAGDVLLGYPMVFFAIWWAWMNFTWFASAYDTDDVPYRLATLVQIAGVLVLAAGVPRALEHQHFAVVVLGYVILRAGMLAQWLRAAHADDERRSTCTRYAAGIFVLQVAWVALLALPDGLWLAGFLVLAIAELAVPTWAERPAVTPWHPSHIAERYGLFTIIVLGESVLAASIAVQAALDGGDRFADVATVAVGGLLTVFSLWWIYFDQPVEHTVTRARRRMTDSARLAFLWGYGHYVVFAGAAATGAGIALAVDQATGHSSLSDVQAGLAVTVPVTCYLLMVWVLHRRDKPPGLMRACAAPLAAVLILASSVLGEPVLATALVLVALVAASVLAAHHADAEAVEAVPEVT